VKTEIVARPCASAPRKERQQYNLDGRVEVVQHDDEVMQLVLGVLDLAGDLAALVDEARYGVRMV
jgi:hypothetical protein